jgi:hypothetical protein
MIQFGCVNQSKETLQRHGTVNGASVKLVGKRSLPLSLKKFKGTFRLS